jgi:Fe/S biogenesis protein NfuA
MEDLVEPVLTVTDAAREKILEVRAAEPDPDTLALRIEVTGEEAGAFTYALELVPLSDAAAEDVVQRHDDLSVMVAGVSIEQITGATLDFSGAGMVIQNPNRPVVAPGPGDHPDADLSGPVAQAVLAILEADINPQIAAHGGRADLVAVEDGVVYVRMSGGCQGCGLASVTLTQGIEVAIVDAVPDVVSVRDVTDHSMGENPYYEAAKK